MVTHSHTVLRFSYAILPKGKKAFSSIIIVLYFQEKNIQMITEVDPYFVEHFQHTEVSPFNVQIQD